MQISCLTWEPAPTIAAEYVEILHRFGSSDELRLWAEQYVLGHAGRLEWDVNFLTRNYEFTNCLNIGAAPFLFEYLLFKAKPDLSIMSVDLNPKRFPRVEEVLNIKVLDLDIEQLAEAPSLLRRRFQCIVFCEIFEHLRINLLQTMRTVRELLDSNGFIYLTMPNGLGLSAWLTKFAKGRTGPDPVLEWRKLTEIGHMGHVREYSAREVQDVLRASGFEVDRVFFRRQSCFYGTVRSRARDTAQKALTNLVSWLGDEIVVVARRRE